MNTLPSSPPTHLATAFAAPTTAPLDRGGDTVIYNSNGFVIHPKQASCCVLTYTKRKGSG